MKPIRFLIGNRRGNSILTSTVAITILAIVAVGIGGAFFGIGRMRTRTEARVSVIDYENAFIQALGEQAMANLITCNNSFPGNLSLTLGDLGSVQFLKDQLRVEISSKLQVGVTSTDPSQVALNTAFNACPINPSTPNSSSPGVYVFCVGFSGAGGKPFQGMLGAFAQVRLDLGLSFQTATQRVLENAITCNTFRSTSRPQSREIKITYTIFFKKFNDPSGIFSKSGSRFYSQ